MEDLKQLKTDLENLDGIENWDLIILFYLVLSWKSNFFIWYFF
jgi:hypothetical protein